MNLAAITASAGWQDFCYVLAILVCVLVAGMYVAARAWAPAFFAVAVGLIAAGLLLA